MAKHTLLTVAHIQEGHKDGQQSSYSHLGQALVWHRKHVST